MLTENNPAPEFTLTGVYEGNTATYDLQETTDAGNAVLLLFYPADFSPVCTSELCKLRDAEWFGLTENLQVWAVSGDSTYSHRAYADEYGLSFPLLSDTDNSVARDYSVDYEVWEGHKSVPKRAVFVIDTDRMIRYAWSTDDAYLEPDYPPIMEAVDELGQFVEMSGDVGDD